MSGDYANAWLKAGEQVRILEARCARLQQALREIVEMGLPDQSLVVRAREALAGPGSEQSSLTESGSAGLPDTPAYVTTFQWLIERGQPEGFGNPEWLEHTLDHPARDNRWTRNAWDAAMFPDRAAAQSWIDGNELEARPVEHGFADTPADSQEDKT